MHVSAEVDPHLPVTPKVAGSSPVAPSQESPANRRFAPFNRVRAQESEQAKEGLSVTQQLALPWDLATVLLS
jgi:hypothetical protein